MWLWSRHSVDVVDMTVTRRAPAPLPNGRPENTPAEVPGLPAQPGGRPAPESGGLARELVMVGTCRQL
jgi:hypothetical protein